MILFYQKSDGAIIGTIDGRIHSEDHLKMWIGDKAQTDRIVVNWKPVRYFDKDSYEVPEWALDEEGNSLVFTADFEPNHPQKDIFIEIDKQPIKVYDYKVNVATKSLVKIK